MDLSAYYEKGWRLGVGIILKNQENKIFMVGTIDEALEKAKKMAKENA